MNQLLVQGRVSDKSVFMLISGRRFHVATLIYISKCLYFQTFFCLLFPSEPREQVLAWILLHFLLRLGAWEASLFPMAERPKTGSACLLLDRGRQATGGRWLRELCP